MPLIDDDNLSSASSAGGYGFTHANPDTLQGVNYTVVNVGIDHSGSTHGFSGDLLKLQRTVVEALQKSPAQDSLLLRQVKFNHTLKEIHGFVPVLGIDASQYPALTPEGGTALYDASVEGMETINAYAKVLDDSSFMVNGLLFILTDGLEYGSRNKAKHVAEAKAKILADEHVTGITTILLGINVGDAQVDAALTKFKTEGSFDHYEKVEDVTPASLAKLIGLIVSTSVSASQSITTGGPISVTF